MSLLNTSFLKNSDSLREILIIVLISSLLIFSPIISSGKNIYALMIIEIIGLLLLVAVMWSGLPKVQVQNSVKWYMLASVVAITLYVIPLPLDMWNDLPGRELYQEVFQWLEADSDIKTLKTLSLVPLNTLSLLITMIPVMAIFLATTSISKKALKLAIYALLVSATIQGIIALFQYTNYNSALAFLKIANSNPPKGTYLNQNHFTAFMEMAEPIALALMINALLIKESGYLKKTSIVFLFAAISLLLTFSAFVTTSRMGTALLLLSIVLSFWAMTTVEIRKTVATPILILRLALFIVIIIAQFTMIKTIVSTTAEMQPAVILGDLRWDMFTATWEGIKAFFPFGSGPGTMPQIIQAFLPADNPTFQKSFVNHVHNDYLELIFEMGIIGVGIILAFIALYMRQWLTISSQLKDSANIIQSGAGIGILIFLIFSLTDFNLHTPANVIFLTFLCGIFFRLEQPNQI